MEPHTPGDERQEETSLPFPNPQPDIRRDQVATPEPTSPPVAAPSRHLYTMTVDQVVAKLYDYQLIRDVRTVQRWCKAGKLRAIIDEAQGERYLVDPASVHDMVATLLAEREAQAAQGYPTSRPGRDDDATARATPNTAAATPRFNQPVQDDTEPDVATNQTTTEPVSEASRDEVATLRRRVDELEKEKLLLSIDKQSRESMIEFMKEKFNETFNIALDNSQKIGQLQAENAQLRALLPSHATPRAERVDQQSSFAPQNIQRPPVDPLHNRDHWQGRGDV